MRRSSIRRVSAKRSARDVSYPAAREAAARRDGGRCVRCGKPVESFHHRQGRGGPDPHRLSGLISVCGDGVRGCHGWIHAHPDLARAHGLMVPRLGILTTQDTPVLTIAGWVLLADDGTTTKSKELTHG